MTERVTAITVRAFRGVPDELTIELPNGRSLVTLGDNGTGKSTIADALEFYFTGQIQFLAREGRAIIQHQSADPTTALVEVKTTGVLGGHATISESVEAARSVGAHETFLLSGRTLAEFVDKTKGEKWRYLFHVLGLGPTDQLRLDLQQARNVLEGERMRALAARESAASTLRRLCSDLTEASLLAAIRATCEGAGVAAPDSLDTALQQDWAAAVESRTSTVRLAARFQTLVDQLGAPPPMPSLALLKAWNTTVGKIEGAAISRVRLLEAAETHLGRTEAADACPLCGQAIKQLALRKRISDALTELRSSSQTLNSARRTLKRFINSLATAVQHRRNIVKQGTRLGIELPALPPDPTVVLHQNDEDAVPVDTDAVEAANRHLRDWDAAAAKLVREAAPHITPQDQELVNLIQLIEQGKRWREAESALLRAQRALELADRINRAYASRLNAFVCEVLERISNRVASIYARLHSEEDLHNISVETWGDKGVELAIDFHGVHQRPPHGVLSESHLNSLGIALFLAMAEAFNKQLGFLILDDVVNSLDVDHRGRLAEFLAAEYQDQQIIVLTHDRLLYERLRKRAPNWRTIEFTSWTYEEGPRFAGYDVGGFLEKALAALDDGDLQGAASKGRRALEELLQDACEGIGASLAFRRGVRNDRREVGELLIGLRRARKENKAITPELSDLLNGIEADLQAALNVEAHASAGWASTTEVADALHRVESLEQYWTCGSCDTRAWAVGAPPHTHCRCRRKIFPPETGLGA